MIGMPKTYTKDLLAPIALNSRSYADVARGLGIKPHGGGQAHLKKRILEYGLDTSHFLGRAWSKGKSLPNKRKSPAEIFVLNPPGSNREKHVVLVRAMLESGVKHECAECGLGPEWQGKPLVLIVDHIDGSYLDSRKENLRFLCSNCDSQTSTYKNRKRKPTGDGTRFETGRA